MTREMEILQDREGFYIAYDGFDMCRTYRFATFAAAEVEMAKWAAEDEENEGYQRGFGGWPALSNGEAYRKGYAEGANDRLGLDHERSRINWEDA